MPPVQESNLYRTINTTGNNLQHKINNYRTTSVLKVPSEHKIKHFNTIFSTKDAPKHKFQAFQDHHNKKEDTSIKCKHSKSICEQFQIKVQGHLHV